MQDLKVRCPLIQKERTTVKSNYSRKRVQSRISSYLAGKSRVLRRVRYLSWVMRVTKSCSVNRKGTADNWVYVHKCRGARQHGEHLVWRATWVVCVLMCAPALRIKVLN